MGGNDPYCLPSTIAYSTLLTNSFVHWLGRPLVTHAPSPEVLAQSLYEAPFVLVSHGVEADPVFCYANRTAQELWGMDWEEFTNMPSRLSAETVAVAERQRLLERAARHGYIDNYRGVRVTKSGRRFEIANTVLWNVINENGEHRGQAAMFSDWKWLE